jgi:CheY-like chemotaxis protein
VKHRPLILLAEDSKVQARIITMILNRYNFDVEIATNGEIALQKFRTFPKFDLVLMVVTPQKKKHNQIPQSSSLFFFGRMW